MLEKRWFGGPFIMMFVLMDKSEMKKYIRSFDIETRDRADRAYSRYWQRIHRLKENECMMELSRTEYLYYFLQWEEMREIFSQLKKKPTIRRTKGGIHFTSSACRFITLPLKN